MWIRLVLTITFILPACILHGQPLFRFSDSEARRLSLSCEISQNLIIIPARINHSSNLKLVLDTGISSTIITGLSESDSIPMNTFRKIKVGGLGDGTAIEAIYSSGNHIEIGSPDEPGRFIAGSNIDVYVLTTDEFELSRQLGIRVNGLVGAEVFENHLVEIDPINKIVTFHSREKFNFRKGLRSFSKIPLTIIQGKAYIDVDMLQENDSVLTTRLLVDTGASLSFWIAPVADSRIIIPSVTVRSLLGQGLNGPITGVNGRVKKARIGPFEFKSPMVSYPDSSSVAGLRLNTGRHGSIGNDVLRRYTAIFDFSGSALYLKPNRWFKNPFTYNRSGMEVEKVDPMLPVFAVYNIIPGSPADLAGIRPGDILEYMNNQPAVNLGLDDINSALYGSNGKMVLLRIDRNGTKLRIKFRLAEKI